MATIPWPTDLTDPARSFYEDTPWTDPNGVQWWWGGALKPRWNLLPPTGSGGGSGSVTSVTGTGTVSGITLTGAVTTSGSLTLGGTLAVVDANISGTISDAKIFSAATWNAKQAALVSGTNIKTINGVSILGSGDLVVAGSGGGDALVSGTLDQFADVTQTAGQTLAITSSTTLAGGTHSGTNTGDNAVNSNYSGLVTNATHSGDATGDTVLTLATVNASVGSYGTNSIIPQITVDGKGRITGVLGVNVIAPAGTLTGTTLASGVTASSLTSAAGGTFGTAAFTAATAYAAASHTHTSSEISDATSAATASKVVIRDASGNASFEQVSCTTLALEGTMTLVDDCVFNIGAVTANNLRTALKVYEVLGIACSDETTILTTGQKVALDMPFGMVITRVYGSLTAAPTVSACTVDIEDEGTSILNAVLSFGTTANNAETSTFASAASSYTMSKGDLLTIDIDSVGSTNAGLKIFLEGYRS